MSSAPFNCPKCGTPLPADAPAGLCPRCLAAMNFATDTVLTGAEAFAAQPPLSPSELAPHFPQLEILECLGRGGMGVVYKARQKSLNRVVALKLLAPERVTDQEFAARFGREALALAQLNHPNIVTVHDFGQAGGFFYLLMEFVDGANLRQLLRARKLTPEEALVIVPPLCEALQFAHDRGIIHRDIKPENLLLDKAGRVKVADFGIAKMLGSEGGDDHPMGTPPYMAPEQMTSPSRVDNRADIYSLGIVFYEMLTGELPGNKLVPPSRKVLIDVRLDEIVLRALEKTPERRWQTAAAMGTELETVVMKPADQAARSVSPVLPKEPQHLSRYAYLSLGLFLAGTLGTLVLMTLSSRHELALIFGSLALVVALGFGIVSWRKPLGKSMVVATLAVFASLGIGAVVLTGALSWTVRSGLLGLALPLAVLGLVWVGWNTLRRRRPGRQPRKDGSGHEINPAMGKRERAVLVASLCTIALLLALVGWRALTSTPRQSPMAHVPPRLVNGDSWTDLTNGLATLQSEWDAVDAKVKLAQIKVDKLKTELGISDLEALGPPEPEVLRRWQTQVIDKQNEYTQLETHYNHLAGLSRPEFRQAVNTVSPDPQLITLLDNLAATEQKLAGMKENFADNHPELRSLDRIKETIERQVDTRLDSILEGLKSKRDVAKAQLGVLEKEIAGLTPDVETSVKRRPYYQARRDLEGLQYIRERLAVRIIQAKLDAALPKVGSARGIEPAEPTRTQPLTGGRAELAQVKLRQAEAELERVTKLHATGLINQSGVLQAQFELEIRRAELAADPVKVARVKLRQAEAESERLANLRRTGLVGEDSVRQAEFDVQVRRAELQVELEQAQPRSTPEKDAAGNARPGF